MYHQQSNRDRPSTFLNLEMPTRHLRNRLHFVITGSMGNKISFPFAEDEKINEVPLFYKLQGSTSQGESWTSSSEESHISPQQQELDSIMFPCNDPMLGNRASIDINLRQLSRRRSFRNLSSINDTKLQVLNCLTLKSSSKQHADDSSSPHQPVVGRINKIPSSMQLPMLGYHKSTDPKKVFPKVIIKSCLKVKTFEESLSPSLRETNVGSTPKNCRFSTTEIRIYPIILGDNPSVSDGPPITIDWNIITSKTIPVEEFERLVLTSKTRRGIEKAIACPYSRKERENMLRKSGYSLSDIEEGMETISKVKKKDRSRANSKIIYKLEEGAESARRKFKRWMLREPRDRILYNRWFKEQEERFGHICTGTGDFCCTTKSDASPTRKSAAALSA
mmetsp:Transcript_2299/g.3507  ORF Transcript_2299/g.3507 Transcript_2299/m.3507 type:complete len:391 (-) Transcript_2299:420-1592(-)